MSVPTGWFKSSYSGSGTDNCVEVRFTVTEVGVRDSKSPTTGSLRVTHEAWARFVSRPVH